MTVDAYHAKFMALSRFALDMVGDEKKKIRRFQRGLKVSIRTKLVPLGINSFERTLSTAQVIERDLEEIKEEVGVHRGKGKATSSQFGPRRDKPKGKRPIFERRERFTLACQMCGREHPSRPCYRTTGACYRCGKMGHMYRDCPTVAQQYQPARRTKERRPRAQGRVYALAREVARNAPANNEGTTAM